MDANRKQVILVVDDEKSVRDSIREILPGEAYEIFEAESSKRALELAGTVTLDMLITDAMLPNMKGRELATRIATLQPRLKALFVSGYSSDTLINHGIFPPGAYFIGKPITGKILLSKVKGILEEGEAWKSLARGS